MDAWGTVLLSGFVSATVALLFRWWDRRDVQWVLEGEWHSEYASGKPTGLVRANLTFHNVGDGAAYRVFLKFDRGSKRSWEKLLRARIDSGQVVEDFVRLEPDDCDSAYVRLEFRRRGRRGSPVRTSDPWSLTETLGTVGDGPRSPRGS